MSAELLEPQSLHISPENILGFVGKMIGASVGLEDDEHPLKSGYWRLRKPQRMKESVGASSLSAPISG